MSTTSPERHEFQTEVRQLLDLMIHSLYSHKDIFLRELISNASDALDKVRFEAITRSELAAAGELEIRLEADAGARSLSVWDNGIGMTREEVVQNIGTIARSGTREFLKAVREQQGQVPPELIGQFGVGFYSSFMVADRITLLTRKAGEQTATRWESSGDGYELAEAERDIAGTTVTLHLKPKDEEDGLRDYTDAHVLRDIVKRYSDFVGYPVRLEGETLNSMKAIWARPKDEVTEQEYREFYKHLTHDFTDPLEHVLVRVEGTVEARALLYIPARAPFDLFMRDARRGVQLYVKRVFIMDDWEALLPPWLRFVRGVVASDDLSLNVSREILQKDRQMQAIRKHLARRVLGVLKDMPRETYVKFWPEFGAVLKEGLIGLDENQERILELVLAPSTNGELTSLADYVGRMKDGQDAIYFMTAATQSAAERSPHLEAFRDKGYEVLFFTDPVDELWLRLDRQFQSKKLVSVAAAGATPAAAGENVPASDDWQPVLDTLRALLQDHVKDVRLSTRLKESPACLVGEPGDISAHLRELLKRSGQEMPVTKRTLEVNPGHPVLTRMREMHAAGKDDPRLALYADLLHGQAVLAEGGTLADPAAFSRRLAELMAGAS
ncbi:MAG TPA: molecular chaperone HtpG [Methylomirabilota bacterium]|nr:molecular chaperone HtpG [Methylomirabilota bacterium]